jgi:hypothetical protein
MFLRLPHENYIKTLIASRKGVHAIVKEVTDTTNVFCSEDIVLELREQMYLERSSYFDNLNEEVDIDWLESHNIDRMFGYLYDHQIRRDIIGAEGALRLLDDQRMFLVTTSLALCGVDDMDIELFVNGKFDLDYTGPDIKEFLNMFFDIKSWAKKEKVRYVDTVRNPELKRAYKDALTGDKNRMLWKLKLSPALDFDECLREIFSDMFYKFKETINADGDQALKYAKMAESLSGRLSKNNETKAQTKEIQDSILFEFDEDGQEEIKTFEGLDGESNA